jgi:excisionase family DNA binding protein
MVKLYVKRIVCPADFTRIAVVADAMLMARVGTKQAAEVLGVSVRRVQAMIKQGLLPAKKLGRDWFINQTDLERVRATHRKPGRPRKAK